MEEATMSHWCPTHTRYSGQRKPQNHCERCWMLFFFKNPEEKTIALETYTELEKMKRDFQG